MDFSKMDNSAIISGVGDGGVRFLELFLREYTALTGEKVTPGCPKCLNNYIQKYKAMKNANDNTSGYVLHAKYENIPLEFGSPILVNNSNITAEYAAKLLEQEQGERYFATLPENAPLSEIEQLHQNLSDAETAFAKLAKNASAKNKEAKQKDIDDAKEALSAYHANAEVDVFEIVLTDDDITGNPELAEAGHEAGETVLVDKAEYEKDGTISIVETE